MNTKNIQKIGYILLGVVLVIGGIFYIKSRQAQSDNAPKAIVYPMVINTLKIEDQTGTLTLPYLALVQNDQDITLTSKIAARILFIKPTGSAVVAGEVIARLDNSSFQTNVQSVQSQIQSQKTSLKNLQTAHQRTLELYAIKGASKEQVENEVSKIEDAKARLESFEQSKNDLSNNLSYTTIKATNSGILSKTLLNVGDVAMPGQAIATVSAKNGGFLKLSVPANLKVKGINMNDTFYAVTPLNSTSNGLAEYKISIPKLTALTGERVPVDVVMHQNTKGISLPYDAILNREGKSYVFVVEGNNTKPVEVKIEASGENEAIIEAINLKGKEIVIAKQDILLRLLSGTTVKINSKK